MMLKPIGLPCRLFFLGTAYFPV
uniref:Uncharacterized protein n=1 Tax=Arundo donax TaxID=35708 RepID=A0A0A9AQN0_ARUDO